MPKLKNEKKDLCNNFTKKIKERIPDMYKYRPIIENFERLNKIADEIKSSPNSLANFLINVGLECFERSIPKLKEELKKNLNEKILKHLE